MTVSAAYLSDLSRVRVTYSGFSANADYAIVERSTDGVTWTLVRGGDKAQMNAGAGFLDDYEFEDGVLNTYRVSAVDSGPISQVPAPGTPVSGNNTSLTPGLPASGLVAGDTLFLLASIRNTSATVNTPSGWSKIVDFGNFCLFSRRYAAGVTAPTVTFSGGASGDDTLAQVTAFHNANPFPRSVQTNNNGSNQNVALPALTVDVDGSFDLWLAWKQDDWTSATTSRGFAEIGDFFSTAGNDSAMWWEYTVQQEDDQVNLAPTNLVVTGGAAAVSKGVSLFFGKQDWVTRETGSITPSITSAWLKNPSRPSLNFPIEIVTNSSISRASRTGVFAVKGRTLPVSVSDKQSSRTFTIGIDVNGYANIRDIDTRLASGEPWFLQLPNGHHFVPTTYVVLGDIELVQDATNNESMTYSIPMTEVAKPGITVYGDTYIWNDVITDYATWADVLATVPDWSGLVDKIGDSEIIVT